MRSLIAFIKKEFTEQNIGIHPENGMQIIDHTVKAKRIDTADKKLSSAHLIDPVHMNRKIRSTIAISQNDLSSINPAET